MKILLLLTGTIKPSGMSFLERSDPDARLQDYYSSINYWIKKKHLFNEIIFCENSGYPFLQNIPESHSKLIKENVRTIQFNGNDYNKSLGKGYGEIKIIEKAIDECEKFDEYDYVVKCTGRLYVPNIERILKSLKSGHDMISLLSRDLRYADSRVFVTKPKIMREIVKGFAEEVNDTDGIYFEHVLARRINLLASRGYHYGTFWEPPYFIGISGSTAVKYNSIVSWAVHQFKSVIYRLIRVYSYI